MEHVSNSMSNRYFLAKIASSLLYVCLGLGFATAQEGRIVYEADLAAIQDLPQLTGVTVDVYWCSGDDLSEQRFGIASNVAGAISGYSRAQFERLRELKAGPYVRSVRLREISMDREVLLSNIIEADVVGKNVVILTSNTELENFALLLSDISGTKFSPRVTVAFDNYLQYVVCEYYNRGGTPARVLLRISDQTVASDAGRIADMLRKRFDNLNISSSMKVVGEGSPDQTQIRYYSRSQEDLADQVADSVSQLLSTDVEVLLLSGAGAVGTVEVWLGEDIQPSQEATYTVCVGEFRERCPSGLDFVPCGVPLREWAKAAKACSNYSAKKISDTSGNRCGYAVIRITCSP